jgi:hypothetical protein
VLQGKMLFGSELSSFANLYVQAIKTPEPRATIVNGAARFEVRPGEYEPDTGSQRAEVTLANPKFYEGADVWVYDKVRWSTADTANPAWEVVDQFHDGSAISGDPSANGSPPIALMRYGQQIRITNGKGSPVYWNGPTVERGRWYELVYHIKFSKTAGEVEAFWNGTKVASYKGPTMNSEYTYFKAGIYRAKETLTGISVVEHDEIGVATSFEALLAGTHMQ